MIDANIKGVDEVGRFLAKVKSDLKQMEPAYKKCSIFLDQWNKQNFKTQGGKVGGWQPFAQSTLKSMTRSAITKEGAKYSKFSGKSGKSRMPNPKLLIDTGEMRKSFVPFWDKNKAGIGSDLPRAEMHNKGGSHLPARRLLPTINEVSRDLNEIFDDHVKKAIKQ